MALLHYTLLVDGIGKHDATFTAVEDLAADAIARAAAVASVAVTEADLVHDITGGFVTVDLRNRDPHIAVEVRAQ